MTPLRVMVVEDEPLAREGMVELLGSMPAVVVCGAHGDGEAALAAMDAERPDVLCIDIRMPGLDGFDVVAALDPERMPSVIFVTAYDAFALRAFEVNAVDYVLKPVTSERLTAAMARVRERRAHAEPLTSERLAALLDGMAESRPRGAGRLIVREVGKIIVIPTGDVDWIEGADYYSRLHVGARSYLIRETLASLERRLDATRFLRIHRSVIVNLARIRAVEATERGDGVAILLSGARLRVTAQRRTELEARLGGLHDP